MRSVRVLCAVMLPVPVIALVILFVGCPMPSDESTDPEKAANLTDGDLEDITDLCAVAVSNCATTLDRKTRKLVTSGDCIVTNTSEMTVETPMWVDFALPSAITMPNAHGLSPEGAYRYQVEESVGHCQVAPLESVTFRVVFDYPGQQRLSWNASVHGVLSQGQKGTIGQEGGKIEVRVPGSPIYGCSLSLDPGAVSSDAIVSLSVADDLPALPSGTTAICAPVDVSCSQPFLPGSAHLTLRFDVGALAPTEIPFMAAYDSSTQGWDFVQLSDLDVATGSATGLPCHFSGLVLGVSDAPWYDSPVETDFRMRDAYPIKNFGPTLYGHGPVDEKLCEHEGHCSTIVLFAQWFWCKKGGNLRTYFPIAVDRAVAEGLICELRESSDTYNPITQLEAISKTFAARRGFTADHYTAESLVQAMSVTKKPQILNLLDDKNVSEHAVLVYEWTKNHFKVYDPNNNVGSEEIWFDHGTGSFKVYPVGETKYRRFVHNTWSDYASDFSDEMHRKYCPASDTGSLQVTITPHEVLELPDDRRAHYWVEEADYPIHIPGRGESLWGAPVGQYNLRFGSVNGWERPPTPYPVEIRPGLTSRFNAAYTYTGRYLPEVLSFRINDGAEKTTSLTVTLNNDCLYTPTEYRASEFIDFSDATWLPYQEAPPFTLSSGNGAKTVYFQVKNDVGEDLSSDEIKLDGLAPSVSSLKINGGASSSASRNVTLDNSCLNGPTEYRASESDDFSDATWLPYQEAPPFTLSSGNGTKTVYFQVKNEIGESTKASDTITLSEPMPTIPTFRINNGAATTSSRNVTLNNTCTGSPTHYMASESSGFSGGAWKTYGSAPSFTLSSGNGTKTVYFKVKNAVGESTKASDTITLSEPVPTISTFRINNGAATTSSRNVTLNNTCTGSPTHYMASESSGFSGAAWKTYSSAPSFTLSSGNGTKTVYFKVKNAVGESTKASDTIILEEAAIEVTSPRSGETWRQASLPRCPIRWTTTGTVDRVTIQYAMEWAPNTYKTIAADVPNTGSYDWYIPADGNLGKARVRVSDAAHWSLTYGLSGWFTIAK